MAKRRAALVDVCLMHERHSVPTRRRVPGANVDGPASFLR